MDILKICEELNKIDDNASLNEGLFDSFRLKKKFPPEARHAQIVQQTTVAPRGQRKTTYTYFDPTTNIAFGPETRTKQELKMWLERASVEEIEDTLREYGDRADLADGEEYDRIMMS